MGKRVFIVAGELSGDHHAGGLIRELKRLAPETHCYGVGGPEMREAGCETLVDLSELAVVGLVEVLKHYRRLIGILERLKARVLADRPDLLILVDYPDFNLRLAEAAKQAGIRVLFYVSPQVWAWRPKRVKKIGARIDHMAVLFPFETGIYQRNGIPVTFVGHPLADEVRVEQSPAEARAELGLAGDGPLIGLFPGSRRGELERHMGVLLGAAERLLAHRPDARFVLALARSLDRELLEPYLQGLQGRQLPLTVIQGRARSVMRAADAIATASGTATLEIALVGTPMVIIYRLAPLTYQILKRMITVDHLGLANIISGGEIVRELIQGAATPEAIAAELERILDDGDYREEMCRRLGEVRGRLGTRGASEKVARLALEMLGDGAA